MIKHAYINMLIKGVILLHDELYHMNSKELAYYQVRCDTELFYIELEPGNARECQGMHGDTSVDLFCVYLGYTMEPKISDALGEHITHYMLTTMCSHCSMIGLLHRCDEETDFHNPM